LLIPDLRNDLPGDVGDINAGVGGESGGDENDCCGHARFSDDR
jgi:hypothetical protein